MKPRLVHIARSLDVGGVETQLVALLPVLTSRYRVSVVCLHQRGALADRVEAMGVPVRVIRFRDRFSPLGLIRLARYLRGADIVQTHTYGPNVSGILAAACAGVPIRLSTVHNLDQWRAPRRVRTDRRFMRLRTGVICVSSAVREAYLRKTGCAPDRCWVVPNGVSSEAFQSTRPRDEVLGEFGIPPQSQVVGVVARLVPEKSLEVFLEAARAIGDARPEVRFLIAGEGPQQSALREKTKGLGLSERVFFVGYRSDINNVVAAMDCFLMTSAAEGFGIAVLESMAAGTPVVVTRSGGVEDIIRSPREGRLVAKEDPAGLVSSVLDILDSKPLARDMAAAGRERAEVFRIEATATLLSETYARLGDSGGV